MLVRELLNQKEQRQLKILEYLFENQHWIHLDALSEILETNARIIKCDIKEMREFLPDFEIQSSTAGIMLLNPNNIGIERIYQYFLKNSGNFQVLEAFFLLEAPFTFEHLAESLEISLPSLRKKVAEINKLLHGNYRFKLKVTPISIVGDERDIRFFFSQYFHEAYGFFRWPFSSYKEEDIEEFVSFFLKLTGFPASYTNLFQLTTQTAVNLTRIKSNNLIAIPNHENNDHSEIYDQLPNYHAHLQSLSERLQISLEIPVLEQIFASYIQPEFFFTVDDFLNAREHSKLTNHSYHSARDVLDNLSRKFGVTFSNTDELVWHLHNTALLERKEINSESIVSQNKPYTLNKMQKFFPEFYENAVFEMMRYKSSLGQKDHAYSVTHLVYTLLTHSEGLIEQLLERSQKVRVLVLSEFDFAHPRTLISLYAFHTSKNIQYEVWDKETLNVDEIMAANYDAILTNFDVKGLEHPKLINISRMSNLQVINELNTISIKDL